MIKMPSELTQEQTDCVIGHLLGDGSITNGSPKKTQSLGLGTNYWFALVQRCDRKEYIDHTWSLLEPFSKKMYFKKSNKPKRINGKVSHGTNDSFCYAYRMRTCSSSVFTNFRHNWYPDGSKIVARNFDLNWSIMAYWYCDDGYNDYGSRAAIIYTNAFVEDDVAYLIDKIESNLGLRAAISYHDLKPTIRFSGDDYEELLDRLSHYITWECFDYKTEFRKAILPHERHGVILNEKKVKDIFQMKHHGVSGKDIAKIYGVAYQTISDVLAGRRWKQLYAKYC